MTMNENTKDRYKLAKFLKDERQVLFKFEKVVDSLISDEFSFTPFISYEKKILPIEEQTDEVT